jgi:hypothetical protein
MVASLKADYYILNNMTAVRMNTNSIMGFAEYLM